MEVSPRPKKKRVPRPCYWRTTSPIDEADFWETTCHNAFSFFTDGPTENGFQFCPYCGKVLKTRKRHT